MNFDFTQEYILENETIRLRPLEVSDFDYLLEYSIHEPEIWEFNSGGAEDADKLKLYIDNALKQRENLKEYPFIVFDKITNKYVGSSRFYNLDFEKKTLEIGYTWYGKKFQGTGINKKCKYLLLDFAFRQLDMERVGFGANSKNERSINAMKSIGCTVEGVLRSRAYDAQNRRIDATILSILKNEWDAELKEKLEAKI